MKIFQASKLKWGRNNRQIDRQLNSLHVEIDYNFSIYSAFWSIINWNHLIKSVAKSRKECERIETEKQYQNEERERKSEKSMWNACYLKNAQILLLLPSEIGESRNTHIYNIYFVLNRVWKSIWTDSMMFEWYEWSARRWRKAKNVIKTKVDIKFHSLYSKHQSTG